MAEQLRFHPLVADDLKAAVGWYDDISPGLGDRFRIAVEERFDSITQFSESCLKMFEQQDYLASRTCCYSNTE